MSDPSPDLSPPSAQNATPVSAPVSAPASDAGPWYRIPLQRRPKDAPFAGVVSAIATAYGFDVRLTRIATVAITLVLPVMVLVYIVAWLVIPATPTAGESAEALITDRRRLPIYIALGVVVLLSGSGIGGGILGTRTGVTIWPGSAAVLVTLTVIVVLLVLLGRRWVPLLFLPPLLVLGAWYFVAEPTLSGGWGSRTLGANEVAIDPDAVIDTRLAGGRLVIDLRTVSTPPPVTAAVGVGTLEVLLPPGAEVRIDSFVGTGVIRLDGDDLATGLRQHVSTVRTGTGTDTGTGPMVVLDLRIGVGVIEITR